MHCAQSDPSNTNRHIQMLPFSLMEQKMRADCIIRFPPSRVLRWLPSAPSEICDVPPSITADSHLAGTLLLKLCNNVPRKDVEGNKTCVNNYKASSASQSISLAERKLRRRISHCSSDSVCRIFAFRRISQEGSEVRSSEGKHRWSRFSILLTEPLTGEKHLFCFLG